MMRRRRRDSDTEGVEERGKWEGVSPSSAEGLVGDQEERRKFPKRSPGQKRFLVF